MFDAPADPGSAPPLHQSETYQNALCAFGRQCARHDGNVWITRKWRFGPAVSATWHAQIEPDFQTQLAQTELADHALILSPDQPCPWLASLGALPLLTPAHVLEWHLSTDLEAMMAALHQKWRNRLRAALKARVLVERQLFPLDPNHWLLAQDLKMSHARGYRIWPAALTLAFAAADRKGAQLFTASKGGKRLGAILVLRHGLSATYHIGHSTSEGKQMSAHPLLLWHAATWLASVGVVRFDLGTIDTRRSPGLARFKLGTGARMRALGGTWAFWKPARHVVRPVAWMDRIGMQADLDSR